MPKNIFAEAAEGEIFRDEKFLYPEFVPERLPYRDAQIDEMVHAFQPVLKGGKPQNVFVFGASGTGKTVTVKYVLRELEAFSNRAKGLYLNCFEYNTRQAVLNQICVFLGVPVPRRGIATDEVYSELLLALKKADFVPLIVLDELDQLMASNTASLVLYDLLRVVEFQKSRLGIIIISNDESLVAKLDPRVRSSLLHNPVEFAQYTPVQLKEILKERAKYAFNENAIDAEVINVAAGHAAKNKGDARLAIESILRAGRIASREGSSKVQVSHLRTAFDSIHSRALDKAKDFLDLNEKNILKLLCEEDGLVSGKLFAKFKKQFGEKALTQRSFRKKLNRLESLKLVKMEAVEKGIRGRTRTVKLAQGKKEILDTIG
ncbi:MAG: AAA family ATPase [Candidatus Diapherotrites archaeon]|nr:AAA family ATPase [Candidatus Diapherotrites archaeon]